MGGSKVSIPNPWTIKLNPVQLQGTVGVNASLASPAGQPVLVNAGLDDMGLTLSGNPKEPLKLDVCVGLAITQIPRIQVHIPTRYDIGFCLFGVPVFNLRVAGETMLLTQDNPPRICFKPPPKLPVPLPINIQVNAQADTQAAAANPISVSVSGGPAQPAADPHDIKVTVSTDG